MWSWEENGAERSVTMPAGNLYIDNEQTVLLPRVLDRRENPVFPLHILFFRWGLSGEAVYRFVGMERLEGRDSEGLFERWDFELRDPQFSVYNSSIWIDPDGSRHIVRMRSSHMSIELVRAKGTPADGTLRWGSRCPRLGLYGAGRVGVVWISDEWITTSAKCTCCPATAELSRCGWSIRQAPTAPWKRLCRRMCGACGLFLQDFTLVDGSDMEMEIKGRSARRLEGRFP